MTWELSALERAGERRSRINWNSWPKPFVDVGKHTAYALIRYGLPETFIDSRPRQKFGSIPTHPAPLTIYRHFDLIRIIAQWWMHAWPLLHPGHPAPQSTNDLDSTHLQDAREWWSQSKGLRRLADFDYTMSLTYFMNPFLPDGAEWPKPAWTAPTPRGSARNENATKAIASETYIPLLTWAVAFVDEFAEDILFAHSEFKARTDSPSPSHAEASELLQRWIADDRVIPVVPRGHPRAGQASWVSVEFESGISGRALSAAAERLRGQFRLSDDPADLSLGTPIKGRFQVQQWIPFITAYDVGVRLGGGVYPPLLAHLSAAAVIVIWSLTGMRPDEVIRLRGGCARQIPRQDGSGQLLVVDGHVSKGVRRKEDGTPGDLREARWSVVPVVHRAIAVLEKLNLTRGLSEHDYLFSETGELLPRPDRLRLRIESFINFVNERLAAEFPNPSSYMIPNDPNGAITGRRFRRTLAWHIRNRPNGAVTLALQFQHVGLAIGEGYAGTKESGMPDERLLIDWEHRRQQTRMILDEFNQGGGISGPAAMDVIRAIRTPEVLTAIEEKRIARTSLPALYDNPQSISGCFKRPEQALCQLIQMSESDTEPNLDECVRGCRNRFTLDEHLKEIENEISRLELQIPVVSRPAQVSIQARIDALKHDLEAALETRLTSDSIQPNLKQAIEPVHDE